MANAIAARIKKMIAPVPPPNVQEPQTPPNQPTPKPQAPKSKHPKQELVMVIPPPSESMSSARMGGLSTTLRTNVKWK